MNQVRAVFRELPEPRQTATSHNLKSTLADAATSAFSVGFTQRPSFLDYQIRRPTKFGKNNAQSSFGLHQLPSVSQVRNRLDSISPETVYPLFVKISEGLYHSGYLTAFCSLGDTRLMPIDGTDWFSWEKLSSPGGNRQTLQNGKTLYRHTAVTPVLVAPGQSDVIPLPAELGHPQDGPEKPDGELAAAQRWLNTWGSHYSPWGITLLGDDLYCHQPFCQAAINQGLPVWLVGKPDSHPLRYEWIADFERGGQRGTVETTRWNSKQRLTERSRYMNQVPLRDSDDALMLNWCERSVIDAKGQMVYQPAWATTHWISEEHVAQVAAAGRARWKVENEGNNVLKNRGSHFEPNFGHGKTPWSNWLATLIGLAYLIHTTFDGLDTAYHTVRRLLPSRRTLFEHLRALLQYLPFESWEPLRKFMLGGLDGTILDSTERF